MSLSRLPLVLACVASIFGSLTAAQDQTGQFNQVININGDMTLNRVTFPDNSRVETFSQTQHQMIVNQNPAPLPATHVVGSTGQPFIQLSQQSTTIQTDSAVDLVGCSLIMSFDPAALQQNQITADNTFIAKLSDDRQAWVIMEGIKTVNVGDNTVRMVRMTQLDGEYVVVGRQTPETGVSLTAFSPDPAQAVQIGGSGIQEVEFQDGFRVSIRASQPLTLQANVVNGVSSGMVVSGAQPVNNYRYLVNSNLAGVAPDLNRMAAVVQLPLNGQVLMQTAQQMGAGPNDAVSLSIEQRAVIRNPGNAAGQLRSPRKRQDSSSASPAATSSASSSTSAGSDPAQSSSATAAGSDPAQASSSQTTSASADQAQATQPPADPQASAGSTPPPPPPPQPAAPAGGAPAATQLLLEPTFTPVARQTLFDVENGRIAVPVDQIDGEFIMVMQLAGRGQQQPAQPGQAPLPVGQPPRGQTPGQQLPAQSMRPSQNESSQPALVPGAAQLPGAASIPNQPQAAAASSFTYKRQAPAPPAGSTGGIIISMAEIKAMMSRQQANAGGWVGVMMDEFVSQSTGQPIPDRKTEQQQQQPQQPQSPAQTRNLKRTRNRMARRAVLTF